jgi:hypothetical protein
MLSGVVVEKPISMVSGVYKLGEEGVSGGLARQTEANKQAPGSATTIANLFRSISTTAVHGVYYYLRTLLSDFYYILCSGFITMSDNLWSWQCVE